MPAVKGKDGPLPSKTIQFADFKKGLMRTGSRDGIPDDGLWESLNAQVIGPGHIQTLTDPAPSIATITPTVVSLWGVMIEIKGTGEPHGIESTRLIAICTDGSAWAIDPATGAQTSITPAGGLDPTARVTMWRDSHVLFAGITTGLSSWDGRNFLTYPATFQGTTTSGSSSVTWEDGPVPADALSFGMGISGTGLPSNSFISAVGGASLDSPATFTANTVSGFPTLLWTAGPTLPPALDAGLVISGTGIPVGTTITGVVGEDLPAGATFTANTVNASKNLLYTGGTTPVGDLLVGLRVTGAGIPAGATLISITASTIPVGSTFHGTTFSGSPSIQWTSGPTAADVLVAGTGITGTGIPAGTTITGFAIDEDDPSDHSILTLSKNATATGLNVTFTVGATLGLSVNATATATGVTVTTGPTIKLSANATATGTSVVMTVKPTITILPSSATASGTVTLTIADGVPKGTIADPESAGPRDLAAFEGRLWLVSGPRGLIFSGTGGFAQWGPVYAGFATTMPDSSFPGAITTIRAAIQLLWIFGPAAINTISNVQVISGITTFQNENLVAGTGTALADSVLPLFRTMVFLSPPGIYAILGATPQKLSDQLDGLMPTVVPIGTSPSATFDLNALLVYAVLVDLEGARRLLIYSRPTWLVADQGADLTWITTVVRTDGQIQCWGTNGTTIRQLFGGKEGDYDIRMKHFDFQMFTRRDTMRRIAVQADLAPSADPAHAPNLQVEVENESSVAEAVGGVLAGEVTWVNNAMALMPWINAATGPVTWSATGHLVFLSEVKFSGNLLSAHIYGRRSVPMILGSVAMEIGLGGEWTFGP